MEFFNFVSRVYIEDTDMMGIVYHANYLRFFERARTELIRSLSTSLFELQAADCNFAVTEINLLYRLPAKVDDLLTIQTKVMNRKACSVIFKQLMYNDKNTLLCEAEVKVACIDGQMKPRRIPAQLF